MVVMSPGPEKAGGAACDAPMMAESEASGAGGARESAAAMLATAAVPPFLNKCYDIVSDPATDAVVSWSKEGSSFIIWDPHAFSTDILTRHFKHGNITSFIRQLNTYGFRKVDPDKYEFANEGFLRGQRQYLKNIKRRVNVNQNALQSKEKKSPAVPCVEVGKYGLDEEIERLKRDKSVLMQELVKLRQHQQNTDLELQNVQQRLQKMELNQQQMMSLLAIAVQNPAVLSQLLQQSGNNRWRSDANKRRRPPALEQGHESSDMSGSSEGHGQIIKYQPFITEIDNSSLMLDETSYSAKVPEINGALLGNSQPFVIEPNISHALYSAEAMSNAPVEVSRNSIVHDDTQDVVTEGNTSISGEVAEWDQLKFEDGDIDFAFDFHIDEILGQGDLQRLLDYQPMDVESEGHKNSEV